MAHYAHPDLVFNLTRTVCKALKMLPILAACHADIRTLLQNSKSKFIDGSAACQCFSHLNLILYDLIGRSFSGEVVDADLNVDGKWLEVAVKFYDPHLTELEESSSEESEQRSNIEEGGSGTVEGGRQILQLPNEHKELTFRAEIEAYERLSGLTICPRYFGAFQGPCSGGLETGLILMEKIATPFMDFSEMTKEEKRVAYGHLLQLHNLGIHHGDVTAQNFGRRYASMSDDTTSECAQDNGVNGEIIIYDFSHSSTFEDCDPESCHHLSEARWHLLEDGVDS